MDLYVCVATLRTSHIRTGPSVRFCANTSARRVRAFCPCSTCTKVGLPLMSTKRKHMLSTSAATRWSVYVNTQSQSRSVIGSSCMLAMLRDRAGRDIAETPAFCASVVASRCCFPTPAVSTTVHAVRMLCCSLLVMRLRLLALLGSRAHACLAHPLTTTRLPCAPSMSWAVTRNGHVYSSSSSSSSSSLIPSLGWNAAWMICPVLLWCA